MEKSFLYNFPFKVHIYKYSVFFFFLTSNRINFNKWVVLMVFIYNLIEKYYT